MIESKIPEAIEDAIDMMVDIMEKTGSKSDKRFAYAFKNINHAQKVAIADAVAPLEMNDLRTASSGFSKVLTIMLSDNNDLRKRITDLEVQLATIARG